MYSEFARVKPQGLAEFFCFVAILRCKDVFIIGGFVKPKRWGHMRLFFLVLLTLVDLIGSAGDWYYRSAQIEEMVGVWTKNVTKDDCIEYSLYAQLKTYADIIFYAFSLVCCVFFLFIAAKFRIKEPGSTIKRYRLYYTIVVAAFWAHCIQCLAGTLVFDQFNGNSTQTTELIYILIYDVTMFGLLFFLIRLKKLQIDPGQCNNEPPRAFIYPDNGYLDVHSSTYPSTDYAGTPSMTYSSTGYVNGSSKKFPTTKVSYAPVDQFDNVLR